MRIRQRRHVDVIGPFGDVVVWPQTGAAYLSWYPASLIGWTSSLEPPQEWSEPNRLPVDVDLRALDTQMKRGLTAFEPLVGDIEVTGWRAGVIVGHGTRDIDEVESELHGRSFGAVESDGYISVRTGKLTAAPILADRVASMIGGP